MPFLPDLTVLAAFTLAAAVLAVTPGPDMTLFLSKTLAQGRRAGLVTYLGASAGLLVHTLFAAAGLTALLAASEAAFAVLRVVGAGYLLWLAVSAVRHGSSLNLPRGPVRPAPPVRLFLTGLGINLANPKIILFFVTFLPQFVSPSDPAATERLLFLGVYFVVLAFPICVALIVAADRIAAALRASPRITRVVDWMFAGVFAGFAAAILLERGRG